MFLMDSKTQLFKYPEKKIFQIDVRLNYSNTKQ